MSKIVLVEEGVFPILKDADGKVISKKPQTGLQIAGTVQGEGKLAGTPSLFIRFASCNLRCMWTLPNGNLCHCDTTYASFYPKNAKEWSIQDITNTVIHNLGEIKHIVITGGEPLLQKEPLSKLCKELKEQCKVHITIETNGSIFNNEVAKYIDLVSISPKLRNSNPDSTKIQNLNLPQNGPFKYHNENRYNTDAIQSWISSCKKHQSDFQLKFVVANRTECQEIKRDFLNTLDGWQNTDILLMPLGTNKEELDQTIPIALQMAITNGWVYTPRVHIEIFGCKMGV